MSQETLGDGRGYNLEQIWNKAQNLKKSVIIGCFDGKKVDNVSGLQITTNQTRAYENL